MIKAVSLKILFIIWMVFILISGNALLVSAQTDVADNLSLMIKISPSSVEAGYQSHKIGYVGFANKNGNLVKFPRDTLVQLESSNPAVATVPAKITIPANSEFTVFEIKTGNTVGAAKIFASAGNMQSYDTLSVGQAELFENNFRLVINLPTSEMNVNTEMPFSLYLQDSDGNIMQAPFDVDISLDYESSLIGVDAGVLTIKKGNSYVWSTIKSKDKVGNAFIRATSDKLGFDEAKEIRISSSLPASLSVEIFPDKIPATLKRDIDVVVGLVDSDGQPTLAQDDIKLQFFSDDESIGKQIDRALKESQANPIIKKGQFSYHFKQRLDIFKENATITIGAATKGLGLASDTFYTVKPITTANPIVANKTMQIFTLNKIPTKSETIAVYQIGTLLPKQSNLDDAAQPTDTQEKEFYPLIVNENYDSSGSDKKINLISSNDMLLKIKEMGVIDAITSYGTATITTGQETGKVVLSSTIKGIGSASTLTEVTNTLKQEKTFVFSPTGSNAILFDKNGYFDLFVIALDVKNRPTTVENEVRYLMTPINEILTVEKGKTFSHVVFQGNSIQAEDQETITIKTVPIGESANVGLETQNTLPKEPTAKLRIETPFETLNADYRNYAATVQILDLNDNPITLASDLKVKIIPSKIGIIDASNYVTIPKGTSYVEFPIETKDKAEIITLGATAKGIVSTTAQIDVKQVSSKLKISIGSVEEPVLLAKPTELKIYVDDEQENSVSGATLKVVADGSSVIPNTIKTNEYGNAVIQFNATKTPRISLQILASAEGYGEEQKTVEFDVKQITVEKKTEIPEWIIYVGIGIVVAVVAGVALFLKKPKLQLEDEEEYE